MSNYFLEDIPLWKGWRSYMHVLSVWKKNKIFFPLNLKIVIKYT